MPDPLFRRAKQAMARRGMTFREMVIDALEQSLAEKHEPFVLRDESAGYSAREGERVTSVDINRAIDTLRDPERGL